LQGTKPSYVSCDFCLSSIFGFPLIVFSITLFDLINAGRAEMYIYWTYDWIRRRN
jgi:hypothetical protein